MKNFFDKAKQKTNQLATELRPEVADVKRTADRAVDIASKAANGLGRLGKDALKTDLAKQAAAGAAVGAVVAIPVPLIGPMAGAVIGAGLGVYKSITRPDTRQAAQPVIQSSPPPVEVIDVIPTTKIVEDKYSELTKLHDLKVKGVLTEEEFAAEKKKILDR